MIDCNDKKHPSRANLKESNEKAASQLILMDFFWIPLKWCSLREVKGSSLREFARIPDYSCSKMSIGMISAANCQSPEYKKIWLVSWKAPKLYFPQKLHPLSSFKVS